MYGCFARVEKSGHKEGFLCAALMAPRFARKQREKLTCMELQAACYIILGSNQSQTPTRRDRQNRTVHKFVDSRSVGQAQRKQKFIHLCPKNSVYLLSKVGNLLPLSTT